MTGETVYPSCAGRSEKSIYATLNRIENDVWMPIGESFMLYDGSTGEWEDGIPGSNSLGVGKYGLVISYDSNPIFGADDAAWDIFFVRDGRLSSPEMTVSSSGAIGEDIVVTLTRTEGAKAIEVEVIRNDENFVYSEVVRGSGSNRDVTIPGTLLNREGTYNIYATAYGLVPYEDPTEEPTAADSWRVGESVELTGYDILYILP